jgi:DHA1 family multidrug resistance protein-like MFS transporter
MPVVLGPVRSPFRGLPREVPVLSAVGFTVALGYGIVAPAIPQFARQFGVSVTAAASVISVFALLRVAGALPAGRLVDRFGEPGVMAAGIALVAVSSVLSGFSGSFAELIVLRGSGGIGSALFSISGQALLLGRVPGHQRGRASGLYSGGFLLGSISGPAVGGLIAAWSLRAPFFIYGGLLIVPALIAMFGLRRPSRDAAGNGAQPGPGAPARPGEQPAERAAAPVLPSARAELGAAPSPRQARSRAETARALRSPVFRAAAAANLADGFAALGVRGAIVPLFVREVLHRSPVWTGVGFVVFAALNGAALLPGGRVADTIGRRPVIVCGCVMSAAGLVLLAVLSGPWAFLAGLAVAGLGSGLLDVAPAAMIGDILGRRGGTMVAEFQMAGDVGAVAGPVAAGFLVDTTSYAAAFALAAAVLTGAAFLGVLAPETRPGRQAEQPEPAVTGPARGRGSGPAAGR